MKHFDENGNFIEILPNAESIKTESEIESTTKVNYLFRKDKDL